MGMLIEGQWSNEDRTIREGAYVRPNSSYGEPIPATVIDAISADPGRFHLIASLSCPWSHRTMLTRALKDLDHAVPLHIAGGPRIQGYRVGAAEHPWTVPGTCNEIEHLHQLYRLAEGAYTGRVTVPVLWDAETLTILSNESVHILRGLDAVRSTARGIDWTLRPTNLLDEIGALASRVQRGLSNAVYRAGKAQRQDVYDQAVDEVFASLDFLDDRLGRKRFLHGAIMTETDLRLWPTLARFDAVYHGHFKCTRRRLSDYPNLWAYARDIRGWRGVAATFDEASIRVAYYGEDKEINPHGIVATAPDVDWNAPHGRDILGPAMVALRDGSRVEVDPANLSIAGATSSCQHGDASVDVDHSLGGGPSWFSRPNSTTLCVHLFKHNRCSLLRRRPQREASTSLLRGSTPACHGRPEDRMAEPVGQRQRDCSASSCIGPHDVDVLRLRR